MNPFGARSSKLWWESVSESRVGHIIIQYVDSALSRAFVSGILILEAEWTKDAAAELIGDIDFRIVNSVGAGPRHGRVTFDVEVFIGEPIGGTYDPIESDEERGIQGIHNQIQQTQEMIEAIPETVDDVVSEQYSEIEDIIESQELNEEEKRRRVQDKLRVGLEMGLPTIMYEGSAEDC